MATETSVHLARDTPEVCPREKCERCCVRRRIVDDDDAQISAARYFKLASELRTLNYTRAGSRKFSAEKSQSPMLKIKYPRKANSIIINLVQQSFIFSHEGRRNIFYIREIKIEKKKIEMSQSH